MRRVLDALYMGCGIVGAIFLALIAAVILYQVFGRTLGYGIPGVDDLAALFLVATAFLSLAYTFRAGAHIRVNLLLHNLSRPQQRLAELWCLIFGAGLDGVSHLLHRGDGLGVSSSTAIGRSGSYRF